MNSINDSMETVVRLDAQPIEKRPRPTLAHKREETTAREAEFPSLDPLVQVVRELHDAVHESRHEIAQMREAVCQPRSDGLNVAVTAFSGLGYALSARALLFLALIGAFVLALMAIQQQSTMAVVVLVAYAVFTVVPVTVLEIRKART